RPVRHQRPMPEDFMIPNLHGGIKEAIAEQASRRQLPGGLDDFRPAGMWTIHKEAESIRPDLAVAYHWLAVKPRLIRRGGEKYVSHLVFFGRHQLVIMPVHPRPAMGPLIGVADRSEMSERFRRNPAGFVQPA